MPQLISKQKIEDIRYHNEISEVIGAYLQLTRSGSNFKALCPFHKEKTPSFHVNPQRQIFHCFGCGKGGDIFSFLMEYEKIDFSTAARMLANRAGIMLEFEEESSQKRSDKDILFKLHEAAALFYQKMLTDTSQGEAARNYLNSRKLSSETIGNFQIGYAPATGDDLRKWAKQKKYTFVQLESAGLIAKSNRNDQKDYYDRFRNRLMIPIRDQLGRVIAFTGRVISSEQSGGKYVNSPETQLFQKGRTLFALDKARRAIVESRQAILCEGQIDAIRCHQEGIENAVASQGTALTNDHAQLLKRYADEIILVLDADVAGEDAALRSAEVFIAAGLSLRIAALPKDEDPDTLLLKKGAAGFRKLIDQSATIVDFHIDVLAQREDLQTEAGLMRATSALMQTIKISPSHVQQDQLLQQTAERLGLRPDALRADFRRVTRRQQTSQASYESTEDRIAHPPEETTLAALLLAHRETANTVHHFLPLSILTDQDCRTIIELVLKAPEDSDWNITTELTGKNPECMRLASELQMQNMRVVDKDVTPEKATRDLLLRIWSKTWERRRSDLRRQMVEGGPEKKAELSAKISELTLQMSKLRQGWATAEPLLELYLEDYEV